jgi:integrase
MQSQRTYAPRVSKVKRPGKRLQWRVQIWDPNRQVDGVDKPGWISACDVLRIPPQLFDTKGEAREVAEKADQIVNTRNANGLTVAVALDRWLSRPLGKESSRVTSVERVKVFRERHGDRLLEQITDELAAEFGATAPASHREGLRTFFNWAVNAKLIPISPFRTHNVPSGKSKGNKGVNPPSQEIVNEIIATAKRLSPNYGAWLEFGAWVGSRPGETDTLRWTDFSPDRQRVRICRQWNEKANAITLPKNGLMRWVNVPPRVQEMLRDLPSYSRRSEGGYVFPNTRGGHFTPGSRSWYWNAVKAAVPMLSETKAWTPYMVTRHFCGWYMVNVLEQPSEFVADQLGHTDDGDLVRKLYGHRSRAAALRAIDEAHNRVDAERRAQEKTA